MNELIWHTNNGVLSAEANGFRYQIKLDPADTYACVSIEDKFYAWEDIKIWLDKEGEGKKWCQSHASALTCAIEKALRAVKYDGNAHLLSISTRCECIAALSKDKS